MKKRQRFRIDVTGLLVESQGIEPWSEEHPTEASTV